MSYYAYDSKGYLGDLASIGGWNQFARWADARGGELAKLVKEGCSENLKALKQQLNKFITTGSNESVRQTLVVLADKAEDCLIVSDGEDSSEESAV